MYVPLGNFASFAQLKFLGIALKLSDAAQEMSSESKAHNTIISRETKLLERDAGHTASTSDIESYGAVSVPDFTPLTNGKGCVLAIHLQ